MHKASIYTLKQRSAVYQAMGAMNEQPSGWWPARASGATEVFEVAVRSSLSSQDGRNHRRAALGAHPYAQAAESRRSSHGRAAGATLGLTAPLHARMNKGLGCCTQHCEGQRAVKRVTTAVKMH